MPASVPEVADHLRPDPGVIPDDVVETWPQLHEVGVKVSLARYLRDLWAHREFAIAVPLGELRAQNQDTAFGQLWHLLNPLFLVAVYWFIFGVVLEGVRGGVDNYVAFLLVGVIGFEYTRTGMQAGARMIVRNRKLVQSINFPRAILPVSALVSETISHVWALGVMAVLLMLTGVRPTFAWLLVVPITIVAAIFNIGAGMIVARASYHFRDVQQLLPYLLRIWFYASGILFSIEDQVDTPWMRTVLELNPVHAIITTARDAYLDGTVVGRTWLTAIVWAVAALLFGFWFFRRAEHEYGRV